MTETEFNAALDIIQLSLRASRLQLEREADAVAALTHVVKPESPLLDLLSSAEVKLQEVRKSVKFDA